jgi:hypothetical protein
MIVATLVIALTMSGAAWWYHYQGSRRAAEFWGRDAAELIIGTGDFTLLELGDPAGTGATAGEHGQANLVAGRPITASHELSEQSGVIHLRHALTQDANFQWDALRREPALGDDDWAYAFQFTDGGRGLLVLLRSDFQVLARVGADGKSMDVLPCPKLGPAIDRYLHDVGVLDREQAPSNAR